MALTSSSFPSPITVGSGKKSPKGKGKLKTMGSGAKFAAKGTKGKS